MDPALLDRFNAGEVLAASRVMSLIERGGGDAQAALAALFPKTGSATRVGITGSTGSGKSSLVNALIRRYRERGETVGVVAEDPTSPFTGGAILGDRVRMHHAIGDPGVFVRSIASRGNETGFSLVATELADALDAFGLDMVLLETIGIGQLEYRIRNSADTTVVVFTPESGDDVQTIKSGLMEIGDIFVVNKSDRPQAARFAEDITATLSLRYSDAEWKPPTLQTVATEETGIDAVVSAIDAHQVYLEGNGRRAQKRTHALEERVRLGAEQLVCSEFWGKPYMTERFNGIFEQVTKGQLSPFEAARRLVEKE